jgi:hypothetical protein
MSEKPIEWTIAREITPENSKSIDTRAVTNQNPEEKYLAGCGCAVLGTSFATAAYSGIAVKYGFATQNDRIAGMAAMGLILAFVAGYLVSRERQRA